MIPRTLFDADHEAFRDAFRRFREQEIAPFHAAREEQGFVDREVWRKAGAHGYLCATLPEAYGGAGADKLYAWRACSSMPPRACSALTAEPTRS